MSAGGSSYVYPEPVDTRLRPTTTQRSCSPPVWYGAESPLLPRLNRRGNGLVERMWRDGHGFGSDHGQYPRSRDFKAVPSLHIDHADYALEVVAESFNALANIEFHVTYGAGRGGDADLEGAY